MLESRPNEKGSRHDAGEPLKQKRIRTRCQRAAEKIRIKQLKEGEGMPQYSVQEMPINDSNKLEIKRLNQDEIRGYALVQDDTQTSRVSVRQKERGYAPVQDISTLLEKGGMPQYKILVPCQTSVIADAVKIKELKVSHIIIHEKSCTIFYNIQCPQSH